MPSRQPQHRITTGNAVTINTDYVVLDLNGFKIGGSSAGFGTLTTGVYATGHNNITIKNGNIRGFYRAIYLQGTSGAAHLVEDIRADGNTYEAIRVEGTGTMLRNNLVVNTGGNTANGANSDVRGIRTVGTGVRVLNNDVTDTIGVGTGAGISILLDSATGAVAENNRLGNQALAASSTAIEALTGSTDVLLVGNRVATMGAGLDYVGTATGKYRDNLTTGVTSPYTGGTDAGNNQ